MFEAVEVGRKVSKEDFKAREPELHVQLLKAQRSLRKQGTPLIIVVAGVELAGKADVVRRLNRWFDARGVENVAFWDPTDEETGRPYYWRFWRRMPTRGSISIMFGSWYSRPIVEHAHDTINDGDFDRVMDRNRRLERMLRQDGALIVKFWFHLERKEQRRRLKKVRKEGANIHLDQQAQFAERYTDLAATAERAIRQTDTGECPWFLVECGDKRYRDLTVGETLLQTIDHFLEKGNGNGQSQAFHELTPIDIAGADTTILDRVELDQALDRERYKEALEQHQSRIRRHAWEMYERRRNVVVVFEGWDAAGKGGAIRRIVAAVDPRLYHLISVSAPTDEELAHHYLWRFWRHIPPAGGMTIYDRSWYGRVLVERVEGFASAAEWQRAYQEINDFEEQLVEHGTVLLKFFMHISPEEQLRRFEEREKTPWKKHKLTDEDWRNRDKWDAYVQAVNEMVSRTSTHFAPWHIIAGNDKYHARVDVVRTFDETVTAALKADKD
ncbi:MAG: polyphosphate:AMP phosphotransferase [Pseudomonadota bacterium]